MSLQDGQGQDHQWQSHWVQTCRRQRLKHMSLVLEKHAAGWVCSLSKSTLLELGSIDTSYHAGVISVGNVSQNKPFMTGSSVIQGRIVLQFSK